jgi:hypothetical protein
MKTRLGIILIGACMALVCGMAATACSDNDANEADRIGVAAECTKTEDCSERLECLPFKGGYCAVRDCTADADCPYPSACVQHSDGKNYCFRLCVNKPECNVNRSVVSESNCVSSLNFVEGKKDRKACEPPSGS